jgi:hypothetical protein
MTHKKASLILWLIFSTPIVAIFMAITAASGAAIILFIVDMDFLHKYYEPLFASGSWEWWCVMSTALIYGVGVGWFYVCWMLQLHRQHPSIAKR